MIVAADACRLAGNGSKSHICPDTLHPGEEVVAIVSVNGLAAYRYINFDQPVSEALLEIETSGGGMIKIWADDVCMGAAALPPTLGRRETINCPVCSTSGVHTLYLEWTLTEDSTAILKIIRFR